MKYLRLWYFSNKRKYDTYGDNFRPGGKINFVQPSFCRYSNFEQAVKRNSDIDAENWFKFLKAYVSNSVVVKLYEKLKNHYEA